MRYGGLAVGVGVIIITLVLAASSIFYTRGLEEERQGAIATLPPDPKCDYSNPALCPQAEENIQVPDLTGLAVAVFGILLGIYLIRADATQRKILIELQEKRQQLEKEERWELLLSVLTPDERAVIAAVRQQPGISQATLRLRTDMSKAKLSMVLKELERRDMIAKIEDGKTNTIQLKRAP